MFLFAWFLFVPLYLCCNTLSYCTGIVASIICANTSTQVASGRWGWFNIILNGLKTNLLEQNNYITLNLRFKVLNEHRWRYFAHLFCFLHYRIFGINYAKFNEIKPISKHQDMCLSFGFLHSWEFPSLTFISFLGFFLKFVSSRTQDIEIFQTP